MGEHPPVTTDLTGRLTPAVKVSQCAAVIFLVLLWRKAFVLHYVSNVGSLGLLPKLIPWLIDTPLLGLRQYLTHRNEVPTQDMFDQLLHVSSRICAEIPDQWF